MLSDKLKLGEIVTSRSGSTI